MENERPGYKLDEEKVRLDLIPPELIFAVGDILTFGARKYNDRDWERGMKWGRVFGATMRHLWAWWGGKGPSTNNFVFGPLDTETGRSHLWHAGCCITFLIAYEERGIGEDDRWVGNLPKAGTPEPATVVDDWDAIVKESAKPGGITIISDGEGDST